MTQQDIQYKAKHPVSVQHIQVDQAWQTPYGLQAARAGDYALTFQEDIAPGVARQWVVVVPPAYLACFILVEESVYENVAPEVQA